MDLWSNGPAGFGFTAAATANDVLRGLDLTGWNVVVTGGHVGLGLEATRALSRAGASVTVASRDPDRAAQALTGLDGVDVACLDLLDSASIDAFAADYLASGRRSCADQQRGHHGRAAGARRPRL